MCYLYFIKYFQIKNDEGWISMETMIKFQRLASISMDESFIMESIKKSTSGLMEVS